MSSARFAPYVTLALATGCFNPTGQVGSGEASTSTTGASTLESTGASSSTSSSTSTSSDATSTGSSGAVTSTTGGEGCAAARDPDAYCFGIDPAFPVCNLDSGACAECVAGNGCSPGDVCDVDAGVCVECMSDRDCSADKPACDPASKSCGCTEHSDCPDTACELDTATCFPPAETAVVHSLAATGPTCVQLNQIGDAESPCCSIAAALDLGLGMDKQYLVVRVHPGQGGLADVAFDIPIEGKNRTIAVLGEGEPVIETSTNAPAIYVDQFVKFFAAGLRLQASAMGLGGAGASCTEGAGAWLDDLVIESFDSGTAIFANACPVQARRVKIAAVKGGVWVNGPTTIRLVNTTIAAPSEYALRSDLGGNIDVVFSTVTERSGLSGHLLSCANAGTIIARNSALLAVPDTGSSACAGATVSSSTITDVAVEGSTTLLIQPADVPVLFADWLGNDLHVKPSATILDGVAIRADGDPLTDLDREPRPLTIGASDWAGADRP